MKTSFIALTMLVVGLLPFVGNAVRAHNASAPNACCADGPCCPDCCGSGCCQKG